MGHDYIDYEDRFIRLSDWDIWTLRHFFCRVVGNAQADDLGTNSATLDALRSFFEAWDWLGPGVVVGTDLTEFVKGDQERKRVLVSCLDRTSNFIASFGSTIPLEYLQEHVNIPTAQYFVAQPTERFLNSIEGIKNLLCEPPKS